VKWYAKSTTSAYGDSSMIQRHLPETVELGLAPGPKPVALPGPWHRPGGPVDDVHGPMDDGKVRGRKRRKDKRRRLMEGREPASQQGNLPTDAVGNAPEGTGRTGLT